MTWGSEEISGFVGASSGCLVLYNRTLIHAFGKVGEAYNNSTKIVSIDDWKLLYPKQLPFQSAYCPYGGCLKKIVAEHYFLKTKPLNNKPLSTISNASVKQVPKTEPDPPFAPLPTSPSPSPIHTIVQTPNANFPPELVYTLIATLLVIFLLFISTIAYICIKRTTKASIYPPPPPSPIHQLLWADSPVKLTLDTKYELQPEESFDLNQSYISFPAQRL
ncbi:hypothetical protein L0F63_000530 [Massospora cicadina]|nr:hypothetical protein L0F63_000530 [Massospora cicadina]